MVDKWRLHDFDPFEVRWPVIIVKDGELHSVPPFVRLERVICGCVAWERSSEWPYVTNYSGAEEWSSLPLARRRQYELLPIAGCQLLNEFHLPLLSQLHSAFDANRSSLDFSARVDYFHRSYFKDRFVLMEYLQQKLLPICDGRCRSFSLDVLSKSDMGRVEISKFVRLWRLSTSLPIKFQ